MRASPAPLHPQPTIWPSLRSLPSRLLSLLSHPSTSSCSAPAASPCASAAAALQRGLSLACAVEPASGAPAAAAACARECEALCWAILHGGPWADAPREARTLYAAAALLDAACSIAAWCEGAGAPGVRAGAVEAAAVAEERVAYGRTDTGSSGTRASLAAVAGHGDDAAAADAAAGPGVAAVAAVLPDAASAVTLLRCCLEKLDIACMLAPQDGRLPVLAAVGEVEAAMRTVRGGDSDGAVSASGSRPHAAAPLPRAPLSVAPADPGDPRHHLVPRISQPSLASFFRDFMCFAPPEGERTGCVYALAPQRASGGGVAPARLGRPVIITQAMRSWPALSRWADPASGGVNVDYLLGLAGDRTVPVEVGGHYMAAGWRQRLMTVRGFVARSLRAGAEGAEDEVGLAGAEATSAAEEGEAEAMRRSSLWVSALRETGAAGATSEPQRGSSEGGSATPPPHSMHYLAQHPLFSQVPALARDVLVPDYCSLLPPAAAGDRDGPQPPEERDSETEVALNAWLGPCGTVSCLHFDAPHNLLCQAVGTKRVLLIDPRDSAALFPHEGSMRNTAAVDPEGPWAAEALRGTCGCGAMAVSCAGHGDGGGCRAEAGETCASREAGAPGALQEAGVATTSAASPRALCGHVRVYAAHLQPGDMLYIPPRWWHHARATSESFSVSCWWGARV